MRVFQPCRLLNCSSTHRFWTEIHEANGANIRFCQFFPKMHEIERIWIREWRPKFYYVGPPLLIALLGKTKKSKQKALTVNGSTTIVFFGGISGYLAGSLVKQGKVYHDTNDIHT